MEHGCRRCGASFPADPGSIVLLDLHVPTLRLLLLHAAGAAAARAAIEELSMLWQTHTERLPDNVVIV